MRKNIPGQIVAGQVNSKLDGSPITTGVSVICTQDNGTFAAGAGTIIHKGNGVWIYLPTQAETNGVHVLFTFFHANAVVTSVQIYTIGYDPQNPAASGGGTGAFLVTVTVTDGVTPLQNATVQVTDLITPATMVTNASGQATFSLNAATYWISVARAGYQFSPIQRTVIGNQSGTLVNPLVMTQVSIPSPPSITSLCRIYGNVFLPDGQVAAGMKITFTLDHPDPIKAEKIIARRPVVILTDVQGRITDGTNLWKELVRNDQMTPEGSHYVVSSGDLGFQDFEITLEDTLLDLASVIQ
jgi:hypothetical protein